MSPSNATSATLSIGRRGSNGSCSSVTQLSVPGITPGGTTPSTQTAILSTTPTTSNVLKEAWNSAAPYRSARKSTLARRCMLIIGGITASPAPSTSACVYSNIEGGVANELEGNNCGVDSGGGAGGIRVTRAVEMYDPRRNKWTQLAAIPSIGGGRGSDATAWFSASSMNEDLLVCGGICDRRGLVADSWRFRSQQRKWTRTADMLKPRARHASTEWSGRVYVIGGITLDAGWSLLHCFCTICTAVVLQ